MRKRKPDNPLPVEPQGDGLHRPARLYGLAHLRVVMELSDSAALDQVCEDAACELERLREQKPHRPWRE